MFIQHPSRPVFISSFLVRTSRAWSVSSHSATVSKDKRHWIHLPPPRNHTQAKPANPTSNGEKKKGTTSIALLSSLVFSSLLTSSSLSWQKTNQPHLVTKNTKSSPPSEIHILYTAPIIMGSAEDKEWVSWNPEVGVTLVQPLLFQRRRSRLNLADIIPRPASMFWVL